MVEEEKQAVETDELFNWRSWQSPSVEPRPSSLPQEQVASTSWDVTPLPDWMIAHEEPELRKKRFPKLEEFVRSKQSEAISQEQRNLANQLLPTSAPDIH